MFRCVFAYVFSDSHGTKMGSTHGTEVSGLRAFGGKRFVVELAGGFGIEREIELVFPTELKPCFADGVVAVLRAGMAFRQIGGVRSDFVGDDPVFDVFLVRQTEMFFLRDVAKPR